MSWPQRLISRAESPGARPLTNGLRKPVGMAGSLQQMCDVGEGGWLPLEGGRLTRDPETSASSGRGRPLGVGTWANEAGEFVPVFSVHSPCTAARVPGPLWDPYGTGLGAPCAR